jgi:hypothetical protein
MICLHPKAPITSSRYAGNFHAGFGVSIDFYEDGADRKTMKRPTVMPEWKGEVIALSRNMIISPTVKIDGKPCVSDGKLEALEDPEIKRLAEKLGVTLEPASGVPELPA